MGWGLRLGLGLDLRLGLGLGLGKGRGLGWEGREVHRLPVGADRVAVAEQHHAEHRRHATDKAHVEGLGAPAREDGVRVELPLEPLGVELDRLCGDLLGHVLVLRAVGDYG